MRASCAPRTSSAQHGYEHVRIDDVAAAAGISKALIYEHFRSKQELYSELMNRAAIEMLGRIVAAASAPERGSGAPRAAAPRPASRSSPSSPKPSRCSCGT